MKLYSSGSGKIVFILLISILILLGSIYLYSTNKSSSKNQDLNLTSSPSPTPLLQQGVSEKPILMEPLRDSKIKSPVKIKGTVPPGWMFEGVFPILIKDSENSVVAQGLGYEVTPGSWQSGEPVEFQATISFPKRAGSGMIVLQNDNPSGLPENSKSFSIPIIFE